MSQLDAVMSRVSAEEASEPEAAPPELESAKEPGVAETSETSETPEVEAPPAASVAAAPVAPPAAREEGEDKFAARFAALSREQSRLVATRQEINTKEASLAEREAAIAAVLEDPDKLFAHLESKLGIKTVEDLRLHAQKAWKKPADEKDRPLTLRELEKRDEERAGRERFDAAVSQLHALVSDDANESKYGAAAMLYSPAKMGRLGDEKARELQELGESFTLDTIAEHLDSLARKDPRWKLFEKRMGKAAAPKAANEASATKAIEAPKAKIPGNDVVTERASTSNGARRVSHAERMRQLMGRE